MDFDSTYYEAKIIYGNKRIEVVTGKTLDEVTSRYRLLLTPLVDKVVIYKAEYLWEEPSNKLKVSEPLEEF